MGLDMYAYCREKEEGGFDDGREIAYWRKHPNLHGWMEQLWIRKANESSGVIVEDGRGFSTFNGVELELTREDIDQLEKDVLANNLPGTTGFFFGDNADVYYKSQDLEFVKNARAELFCGLKVFYNSSW